MAVRAVSVAAVDLDEPVVVLGAGPIGLLTGLVLRAHGYTRATIVSRNPARAERAAALGLRVVAADERERGRLRVRVRRHAVGGAGWRSTRSAHWALRS